MSRLTRWDSIRQILDENPVSRAICAGSKCSRSPHFAIACLALLIALFPNCSLHAQTLDVGSSTDLYNAILTINSNPTTNYTLNFVSGLTLNQQVPDINTQAEITITGNSNSINGSNLYQFLVIDSGAVAIQNLNLINSGSSVTINGGTLIDTTGNLTASVVNNGSVVLFEASNYTYSGIVSGTGDVEIGGPAPVTLSGANNYTGGTFVDNGSTLIGTTGSLFGSITNSGSLQFFAGNNGGYNVGTGTLDPAGTYSGNITGAGSVEISGSGPVTFSGANLYTGGTLVNVGSSLIGTTASLQGAIMNNGSVNFNQSSIGVYTGNMSGTGSVEISGVGPVILASANRYTGGTIVDSGSTLIGTTDSLIGSISNSGSLQFFAGPYGGYNVGTGSRDTAGTYSGNITGAGSVEISGYNPVTFSGSNSYTGGTSVDTGSALIGTTSSLQGAIANSGYVDFNQNAAGTYSGNMSGAGTVEISGSGPVTFGGSNSYTGGTYIDAGSSLIGTTSSLQGPILNNGYVNFNQNTAGSYAGAMWGTGSVEISGTGPVTFSGSSSYTGGTLVDAGSSLIGTTANLQGAITNNGYVNFNQNAIGIYAGNMSGTGSVEFSGTGAVLLTGANSYTGGTIVDSGSSLLGSTDSLVGNISNNGSLLILAGTNGGHDASTGSLDPAGTYSGNITGTGSVEISGSNPVTFSGSNTYTGGTYIDVGSELIATTSSLLGPIQTNYVMDFSQTTTGTYAGNISGTGGVEINGSGVVTLSGLNTYTGGTYVTSGSTLIGTTSSIQGPLLDFGSVQILQPNSGTFAGVITGIGALEIGGGGTVTLTGLNGYSGGTTIDSGSTLIGTTDSLVGAMDNNGRLVFSAGTQGGFDLNTGTTDPVGNYSGNITGTGSVEISGSGPVTFSGANSYSGGTLIDVGSSLFGTTSSLQGSITNNGYVNFNQSGIGSYAGNMSGTGSVEISGSGQVNFTGVDTYTGGTIVDQGSTLGGSTASIQGQVQNNGWVIFNQGPNGTYAGNMSGTGGIEISNSVGLTLTGANTYTGGTLVDLNSVLTGTTTSLQGLIVDNGTVQFLQATNGTFASNISGSGTVTIGGGGNVNFSGTNSYTGGTTINSGSTLTGTSNGLQGGMTDNGSLIFNQGTSGVYSGNISGTGNVQITGGGSLVFAGINSYTGGSTVFGGNTLIGTTSSLQGQIVNNGLIEFSQIAGGVYAGNLSGSGSVLINGTGAVALMGTNSYTGGTTVTSGSALVGTTSSLQGLIQDNGILQFNQTTAGTFAGIISGTGGVEISGYGPVTFTGANTYSGGTAIGNGSTLIVGPAGSIGAVTVDNGGTLKGEGAIGAVTVQAGGTLYPGTVGAPLTINGNFTQGIGSTYTAEMSPTASDKIIVTGAAAIGTGTTLNLAVDPGVYTVGSKYDILTAAGVLSGTYSTLSTSSYTQDIVFAQNYDPHNLQLTVTSNLSNFAQTSNQLAVAGVLDQASGNATGNFATAITQLTTLSPGQLSGALNQVSGDIYPSLSSIQRQTTTTQLQLLSNRLASLTGPGIPAVTAKARSSNLRFVSAQAGTAPSSDSTSSTSGLDPMSWSTWAQGYGFGGSISGDGNAGGVNYRLGGTIFGVERWLGENVMIGILGGYASNSVNNGQDGSSAQISTYQAGLYELYREESFYVSNIDAYNNDNYSVSRPLNFGSFQQTATGSSSGNQWAHYSEVGGTWDFDDLRLQPFAGGQYMYLDQHGYSESGAGSLDMTTSGQIVSSLRSSFGARLSRETTWRDVLIIPSLSARYQHEFGNGTQLITSSFSGVPTAQFSVAGTQTGRDFGLFTLGATAFINDQFSLYGSIDSQVAAGYSAVMGTGGFKFSW